MLAHYGGVAQDISWPGTFDKFVNLHVDGIQYTLTRLVILGIGIVIGVGAVVLAASARAPAWSSAPASTTATWSRRWASTSSSPSRSPSPSARRWRASAASSAARSRASRPGVDANWLLNSLVVVIIGGMGSLGGAAIGSLLLGLTTNFAAAYLPSDYTYYSIIFTFVLLAIVLAVRPLGLFGRPA